MELQEVKKNLNKMVVYKGVKDVYRLTACILRQDQNGLQYSAELVDTKSNSVLYCRLSEVSL